MKTEIYYLSPLYTDEINQMDRDRYIEEFEDAVMHHNEVEKYYPLGFQDAFNNGMISDEGYVVIVQY